MSGVQCDGLGDEHCCWLEGKECKYLERGTVEGRTFACSFYRRLGSWEAVHQDETYKTEIDPIIKRIAGVSCGDWPRPGEKCHTCKKVN